MITFRVSTNRRELMRNLSDFAQREIPFATSLALTATARAIAAAELREIAKTMPTATAFTLRGPGVMAARKEQLTAVVFMKDLQAKYLKPYISDGRQVLYGGRRAQPVPITITTDAAGNIGRGRLKRMIGRKDVFVGSITFKKGETVNGVWQRPKTGARRGGGRGTKGNTKMKAGGVMTGLKLLVRFQDPVVVKPRLAWFETAAATFEAVWQREFDKAFARALSTGRKR